MQLTANNLNFEVTTDGPATGQPLLMIMGLGMQLTSWPQGLVDLLVERGFYVIRFDNRDAGLSAQFDHCGTPNLLVEYVKDRMFLPLRPAYRLHDMAQDTFGVLDALGIGQAHVVGASMGGMIAQRMLLSNPERLSSLTLMMTHTGGRGVPGPTREALRALMSRPRSTDREDVIAHMTRVYSTIGSPGMLPQPQLMRKRIEESIDRARRPRGTLRQMVAIAAEPNRSKLLLQASQQHRVPTQIIHGTQDPLIRPVCAQTLQRALPHAQLDLVEGMGHDLPQQLWPRFVQRIAMAADAAENQSTQRKGQHTTIRAA